jgi:hypothetical protein
VLQPVEKFEDVSIALTVERPVEVPQILTAEAVVKVPVEQTQIVEKQIPQIMTEEIQRIEEVPQVLIEERLVEVPTVQVAEAIRQVPKEVVQMRKKVIPKISTQAIEKVQQVSVPLIVEKAIEVPQTQVVEVLKQTAQLSQQRLVQTRRQLDGGVIGASRTLPDEMIGMYEAQVVDERNTGAQLLYEFQDYALMPSLMPVSAELMMTPQMVSTDTVATQAPFAVRSSSSATKCTEVLAAAEMVVERLLTPRDVTVATVEVYPSVAPTQLIDEIVANDAAIAIQEARVLMP